MILQSICVADLLLTLLAGLREGEYHLQLLDKLTVIGLVIEDPPGGGRYQGCTILHRVLTISSDIGGFEQYRNGTHLTRPDKIN